MPLDPSRFIVDVSRDIAQTEPHLTSDFLTEFFVSWESIPDEQKPLSLEYMAPWLSGLRTVVLVSEADADRGRDKVATLLRKLIDVAVLDQNLTYALAQHVWPSIGQDDVLLEVFVEEVMKVAISYGNRPDMLDTLSSVVVGLGTITVRGRIIARLRKALNRSSLRPTRLLPDNSVWEEICILLQFVLALSFDSRVNPQMFLPEIFHIVIMLANTGSHDERLVIYKLLVNTVHAVCSSFSLDDTRLLKLRSILDILSESREDVCASQSSLLHDRDGASISTTLDTAQPITSTENLTAILFEVCCIAAPSIDVANAWRSRWMSLVASTAFQNNPAVQPRAFAVMGYLAREEVDDDLLYQVLVALRNSVCQFGEDGNSEMLLSIITSLSRMMTKLPSTSRYGLQLFWLAMSLVRLVPIALFNCAAQFLDAILTNIGTMANIRGSTMVSLLLQCRSQLEEAALPLDRAYGIHFDPDTFHFAVCASLVRGLTDTHTRSTAMHVLSSFLEMSISSDDASSGNRGASFQGLPYLALLLARGMRNADSMDRLWRPDLGAGGVSAMLGDKGLQDVKSMKDSDLFLISAIELVDFHCLEDCTQARTLHRLNELATTRPGVFTKLYVLSYCCSHYLGNLQIASRILTLYHSCGALPAILDDVLLHGQESAALEAAHALLHTLSSRGLYSQAMASTHPLTELLGDLGFSGLLTSPADASAEHGQSGRFELTEKLIEVNHH